MLEVDLTVHCRKLPGNKHEITGDTGVKETGIDRCIDICIVQTDRQRYTYTDRHTYKRRCERLRRLPCVFFSAETVWVSPTLPGYFVEFHGRERLH